MNLNHTDRATLAGLYLALFDQNALTALGCSGVWEAFNILGYSLESSPASIKNYRDEFDHEIRKINPNHPRKGWNRPLKRRSQKLFAQFSRMQFADFTDVVTGFLVPSYQKEKLIAEATKQEFVVNVAQRLMTGQAAESYFKLHSKTISEFMNFHVEDVTLCGCGYDFHLSRKSDFLCVEVKGIATPHGSISLTEKEFSVADRMQDQFCLFVVRNFNRTPAHSLFFNPIKSKLDFKEQSRVSIYFTAYL